MKEAIKVLRERKKGKGRFRALRKLKADLERSIRKNRKKKENFLCPCITLI